MNLHQLISFHLRRLVVCIKLGLIFHLSVFCIKFMWLIIDRVMHDISAFYIAVLINSFYNEGLKHPIRCI